MSAFERPFYTIGHSTRSAAELVELLVAARVDLVVDVRKLPGSRANPQFNGPALAQTLAEHQIGYRHIPALGGLRGRPRTEISGRAPATANDYWHNASFRNYADYTATAAFKAGLAELIALGQHHTCAIMCAEAVWWRCHRRFIADYLIATHHQVFHILGRGRIEPAKLNPAARAGPQDTLFYPANPLP